MTAPDTIKLFLVRLDGGTQSRASLSESTIDEYAEAIANGATFPPVTIFHDGSSYWLSEGFHRFHAHERAGRDSIDCEIRQGTQRDAILFGAGANVEHGLRRTNEDKRRAVMTLLGDEEWRVWSDREIARRCGVSQTFVSSLRPSDNGFQIERKVDRRGSVYTMKTAGINARQPAPLPLEDLHAAFVRGHADESLKEEVRAEVRALMLKVANSADDQADNAAGKSAVAEKADRYLADQDKRLAPVPSAKPLRDLVGISGGELARWIKITTPNDRPHVIRVLDMAAAILRDELDKPGSGYEST